MIRRLNLSVCRCLVLPAIWMALATIAAGAVTTYEYFTGPYKIEYFVENGPEVHEVSPDEYRDRVVTHDCLDNSAITIRTKDRLIQAICAL